MDNDGIPCFIDFEASSLGPDSYPVEVAFSLEDGKVESYLIDPSSISYWSDWDSFAESVHKITQEQLRRKGLQPSVVAEIMNQRLRGRVLYSDVHEYDWVWCKKLFEAAGATPMFKVSDASILFCHKLNDIHEPSLTQVMTGIPLSDGQLSSILNRYSSQAWEILDCAPHRAACDVQHLIEVWKLITATHSKNY
jgi:hypothetical protein